MIGHCRLGVSRCQIFIMAGCRLKKPGLLELVDLKEISTIPEIPEGLRESCPTYQEHISNSQMQVASFTKCAAEGASGAA